MYFSFTTLATVGFGDYNPRSDGERIIITISLLFGVAIFSYLMGEFIAIVKSFSSYNDNGGEDDRLATFFGVMDHFNNHEIFNVALKREIEGYFDYRWDQNKYEVIHQSNFLQQVPEYVEKNLYTTFLFEDFLTAYRNTFELALSNGPRRHMRYTWKDEQYRNFMIQILSSLEPIKFKEHCIILDELDDTSYVVFLKRDVLFYVGYSLNRRQIMRIKFKNRDVGGYGASFNKKSSFIFKTKQESEGYFIRKKNWLQIFNDPYLQDCVLNLKK
jgi:hypothetical protein